MSKLTVGIVGAGHIAASHVKGWRQAPGVEVGAITDLDAAAAARLAEKWSIPAVAGNLEEILAKCDVVDLCTPPHTHAALIAAAAEARRHVLVEKPVVTRSEDWLAVRQAVEAADVKLAVVHNIKFSRSVQKALAWVAQGRIGRILRVHRHFLTHPESDRMLTDSPHWSHELPGGRWFETLPHALYLAHAFAGPMELEHVAVLATGDAPTGAPADEVSVALRGENSLATIEYSAHCRANRRRLLIVGTDGVIEVDVLGDSAVLYRGADARWKRPWGASLREACAALVQWPLDRLGYLADRLRGHTPHSRLIRGFARHLQGKGPSPTPLDEIEYVVTMSDRVGRAIDAARTKSPRNG